MPGRVRAPQFPPQLQWLNTDRPLQFGAELKGQVVLLDFWTYCCINCMHVLPDLAALEQEFEREPLVVIGVHSAKFTNERDRRNIRNAVQRYEIAHPVIVDEEMAVWRSFTVRAWPTLVLVNPEGYIVGAVSGEGHRDILQKAIRETLDEHRKKGTLAARPVALAAEAPVSAAGGLAFPGKVCVDAARDRLFIADSNHHRIIISTLPDEHGRCRLVQVVGDGVAGAIDGAAREARFNRPQGLTVVGDRLFVADTENHLIREIDLAAGDVSRFAGTGEIGRDRRGGKRGAQQAVNSPWDLAADEKTLYVAMAGLHQVWAFDLESRVGRPLAGSGVEDIVDGPAAHAALAQPSGLALAGERLFFADSEVSAVRVLELDRREVHTLVGRGLFEFGDADGDPAVARLQHCLGVAIAGERLLVADSYNHRIREVDRDKGAVRSIIGNGRPGTHASDGSPLLNEPGGLCADGDRVFIADTNNHRVLQVNLKDNRWNEVMIAGLSSPRGNVQRSGVTAAPGEVAPGAPGSVAEPFVIRTPAVVLKKVPSLELVLSPRLPRHTRLAAESPLWVRITDSAGGVVGQRTLAQPALPLRMRLAVPESAPPPWRIELSGLLRRSEKDVAGAPFALRWEVQFSWSTDGPESLQLTGEIPPPPADPAGNPARPAAARFGH